MSKTIFVHYVVLAEEEGRCVTLGEGTIFYDPEEVKKCCSKEESIFQGINNDVKYSAKPGTARIIRNIKILEI